MNYLDLFSGIGGFRLGAEWAGLKFDNEFHSDIDDYANKVYAKHFPKSRQLGDITKIKSEELLSYGKEWIITGGFPCQDISIAGKGAGISGARSGLWFEYWRLIRDLRPRFAIVENSGELVRRGLREVLGGLAKIRFNAEWQDIRASDMGAPHRRERIWIIAYPDSIRCDMWRFEREGIQRGNQACNEIDSSCEDVSNSMCKGLQIPSCQRVESFYKKNGPSQGSEFGRAFTKIRRAWSVEPGLVRLVHGVPNRAHRIKCLGNSIVPQIAELLFRNLIDKGMINKKC